MRREKCPLLSEVGAMVNGSSGSFRCVRKMDVNYAMLTNVNSELRNLHQLENFPTAANYASKPG